VSSGDGGHGIILPVHNNEHGPLLPTRSDVNTALTECFQLCFDEDLFKIIAGETNLFGNTNKQKQIPPTKGSRMSEWRECSVTGMKALLGCVINMGLHPPPDVRDCFSLAW
jgi:hypothetical protein